jgi:hypothetical protein
MVIRMLTGFLCVIALADPSSARADVRPVVLTGQIAPGTGDARFASLSTPALNASGDLTFLATLTGGNTSLGIFRVSNGNLEPVALQGQTLPDLSGSTFFQFGDPTINAVGDIVFNAGYIPVARVDYALFGSFGGTLRKIVDGQTSVPGAPGQAFTYYRNPQINDRGDIAFIADLSPGGSSISGIFMISEGVLRNIVMTEGGTPSSFGEHSLNNRGDLVFSSNEGITLYSEGQLTPLVFAGQSIPGSDLVVRASAPRIDDERNVVFLNIAPGCIGRFLCANPNAVVRVRGGALEKVAMVGESISGLGGSVVRNLADAEPQINPSAVMFKGATRNGVEDTHIVAALQGAAWSVAASETDFIEGIGVTDLIEHPRFDPQNNWLAYVAFTSNGSTRSQYAGIYLTTLAATPYRLFFPHVADGGGAGGWRTTITLANRAATASSAVVNFYDTQGGPLTVRVAGQMGSQFTVTIPPLGVAQIKTEAEGTLKTGWAVVQTEEPVSGLAIFTWGSGSADFVDEVGVPATVPLRSMSAFAQTGAGTSTGIAIANPNAGSVNVTLVLRNSDAQELGRTTLTLPGVGQIARYIHELFPAMGQTEFTGKLDISSTQPLVALALRQRENTFTSLPVIP